MGKQDRFGRVQARCGGLGRGSGHPVHEVAERLGISTKSIYTWQPRRFGRQYVEPGV
jgi:transposase